MEKTKKINSSIDITKLLCAILVVALHVKPFYDVSSALSFGLSHIIARVAVPILFACTGYFFSLKLDSSENKKAVLIQYLKRLFFLYIGWSAIYFVFDILTLIKKFDNFFRAFLYYLRNFLFVGSHFHLWYLPAAMLGLLLLYFAIKTRYLKTFVFICLLLYTIATFTSKDWWSKFSTIEIIYASL